MCSARQDRNLHRPNPPLYPASHDGSRTRASGGLPCPLQGHRSRHDLRRSRSPPGFAGGRGSGGVAPRSARSGRSGGLGPSPYGRSPGAPAAGDLGMAGPMDDVRGKGPRYRRPGPRGRRSELETGPRRGALRRGGVIAVEGMRSRGSGREVGRGCPGWWGTHVPVLQGVVLPDWLNDCPVGRSDGVWEGRNTERPLQTGDPAVQRCRTAPATAPLDLLAPSARGLRLTNTRHLPHGAGGPELPPFTGAPGTARGQKVLTPPSPRLSSRIVSRVQKGSP
jgi:hypothetical protein